MTKGNKTSGARETVYDRCAYVGCYNGKFINGRRLFHFPSETDRRLEMWIERSGNFRLRTWAATSLRKAGLCGDHFDDKCFTDATRKALRRNVVPRHYTEDLKFRKASVESATSNNANENETNGNASAVERDENCGESTAGVTQFRTNGACDDTTSQSDDFGVDDGETRATNQKSPSLVVEFIVEELDESSLNDESREPDNRGSPDRESSLGDSTFEAEDTLLKMFKREETEDSWGRSTSPPRPEEARDSSGLRVNRSRSDVRTYYRSKNHRQPKLEPASGDSEPATDDEISPSMETIDPASRPNRSDCDNEDHEKILLSYRTENQHLRKTMRVLKQKLRRAKARETNYMKVREMLRNVDEFLDIQECTNPVARAMVKLALHKRNALYTEEEKHFATQLYRQSSVAFVGLRRAGCNFPGKSTMRRWIAEAETGDYVCATPDGDIEVEDEHVEQLEMLEDDCQIGQDEIGEGEILEEMEYAEGAVDEIVGQLEVEIEDAQVPVEYLEQFDENVAYEEETLK